MSRHTSKDLSHFLSEESKSRQPSVLKEAFKHFGRPDIRSLGGGLPLPSLFPFDGLSIKSLKAPFTGGIDQDILEAEETIDIAINKTPTEGIEDIPLATSLQYGQSHGDIRMRDFIKDHTRLVHDVGFSDWDVVLTCGNTFSWDSVLRTFVNRGDVILIEEFSFSSALECAYANGAQVLPVKMDLEGIVPEALDAQLANWSGAKPKLLYTIPTGQNPTGSCLSAERRKAIYSLAQKYDFLIVEDEPYYFLQMPEYEMKAGAPNGHADGTNGVAGHTEERLTHEQFIESLVPSFLHFDTEGRVLRLDSFSKVLAPGTRIGWVVAQERFCERLLRLFEVSQQTPSGFSQSIVNGLLRRWGQGGYLDWLIELRKVYTAKRDLTMDAVFKYLPAGKFVIEPPVAGMFFWLRVDARLHPKFKALGEDPAKVENELYEEGLALGVQLVPGHWFKAGNIEGYKPDIEETASDKNAMFFRGTFASVPPKQIEEAIERFAKVLAPLSTSSALE